MDISDITNLFETRLGVPYLFMLCAKRDPEYIVPLIPHLLNNRFASSDGVHLMVLLNYLVKQFPEQIFQQLPNLVQEWQVNDYQKYHAMCQSQHMRHLLLAIEHADLTRSQKDQLLLLTEV